MTNTTKSEVKAAEAINGKQGEDQYVFRPAVKILIIQFGLASGVGIVLIGIINTYRGVIGGNQVAEILSLITGFIILLVLLRLLIRIIVLRRTTYTVTQDKLKRNYELLYKRRSREVPLHQLRGMDYEQSRLQSMLGYGTVTFLTAGTNQSLGFLSFENVNEPQNLRSLIQEYIE